MDCAECEEIQKSFPGARCGACFKTAYYLLEQDECRLESLWEYVKALPGGEK